MIGKNTKVRRRRYPHDDQLVVGEGSDMQFNPRTWDQWQNDACDKDDWKYGRVSDAYRDHYDATFGSKPEHVTKEVAA